MQTLCSLCFKFFIILAKMVFAIFCLNTLELYCSQHILLHFHRGVNGLSEGKIMVWLVVLKQLLILAKYVLELGTKTNTHKVSLIQTVCVHLFVFMETVIHQHLF